MYVTTPQALQAHQAPQALQAHQAHLLHHPLLLHLPPQAHLAHQAQVQAAQNPQIPIHLAPHQIPVIQMNLQTKTISNPHW